ncbi:MAG TPA: class II fumarate hydratase [Candidatus Lokiarchaeia archaeon]|nr:class II fumarate hydratase [Candidatus Lokiarchaeia archaeon]
MTGNGYRVEKDVLGEIEVPEDKYWGINTQRAIENFKISGRTFPPQFIEALALVKKSCALANLELNLLQYDIADAMIQAIDELMDQHMYLDQFPIDIFQTGSGTQTNMNMNEVIANRANELLGSPKGMKSPVHPNDHVNMGQSSNDAIPTAMHVAALRALEANLFPAMDKLLQSLNKKVEDFKGIIKVGRTHLQDAVPIPLSMEFEVYAKQIGDVIKRIQDANNELLKVPIGGTALGTGINSHEELPRLACKHLSDFTGMDFVSNPVKAEGISTHGVLAHLSATLKSLALALMKMANDIRLMGSGPRAGLGELRLPENEPGSSIMPGKVNPTQSEALIQACLQVQGNDLVISLGETYGSILDMNTCKPLIINDLLYSIEILSGGITSFIDHCLGELQANGEKINMDLDRMLMVVTNLVPFIGYDKAAEVARMADESGKTIKQVVTELDLKIDGDLDDLLDPRKMVSPMK